MLGITKAAQQQKTEAFPASNLDGKDGISFLGNPGNGKSTLINRLIGKEVAVTKKKSIYDDLPSAYIGENNLASIEVPSSNNWVGPKKYPPSAARRHTFVQQIKSVKAIVCVSKFKQLGPAEHFVAGTTARTASALVHVNKNTATQ